LENTSGIPDGGTLTWKWRPDPALYLAVMTGNFELVIQEAQTTGNLSLEINIMVSGWKSIMGSPDKKRTSRRSSTSSKTEAKK
jgi:hypothetical protein